MLLFDLGILLLMLEKNWADGLRLGVLDFGHITLTQVGFECIVVEIYVVIVVRWVVGPICFLTRVVAQIADCAILVGTCAHVNMAKALAWSKYLVAANKKVHACF